MQPDQIFWIAAFLFFVMLVVLCAYLATGVYQSHDQSRPSSPSSSN